MRRETKNILFLFTFMFSLLIGRTDYVNFSKSLLTEISSKLSKPSIEGKLLAEQHSMKRVLPNEMYVKSYLDFNRGMALNKDYIRKKFVDSPSQGSITTTNMNRNRDGPAPKNNN